MTQRAAVIGLDGAAWHLLDPLIGDGVMPRLANLRDEGASGDLASTVPPVTPPAWTSAATGVNPGRHGIHGFHRGTAQDERNELMHVGQIQTATLWEIANAQGKTVGVYNMPLTYPPQKLDGWMVSGFMTPGIGQHVEGFAYPEDVGAAIARWQPDYIVEVKTNQEQDWRDSALAERVLVALQHRKRVLTGLLDDYPVDIVFAVLESPDRLQHLYYRYMDPNDELYDSPQGKQLRPAIARCFAAMDEIIGLLDDYADGGALVCSDHGFTAWEQSIHTNSLLHQWGYLKLKPRARLMQTSLFEKAVPLLWRVTPTRLRRRAKQRAFSAIDWSRTKAFGSVYYQQGVFVNVAGRQRYGVVNPADLDRYKDEIAERFATLTDDDGRPITGRIWRSEEAFTGHAVTGAPDLMFEIGDFRYVLDDELFHRRPFSDYRRLPRGAHHPTGIVACTGPGVARGAHITGSVMDVTPTLLYLAGLRIPEGLDGRVLTEAFRPEQLAERGVETMPAAAPVHRDAASPYSKEEEAAIEESLKQLGYL